MRFEILKAWMRDTRIEKLEIRRLEKETEAIGGLDFEGFLKTGFGKERTWMDETGIEKLEIRLLERETPVIV